MNALKNEMQTQKIIFFDGVCHLCNTFIDFLIRADAKQRHYHFASLQGDTAEALLPVEIRQSLASVVFYDQGTLYQNSEAILRILTGLGGLYKLTAIARIFPEFIRDGIYRWIAKNRYTWFGEREFCRIPQSEEKEFLLP